jgi:hypothetical protein
VVSGGQIVTNHLVKIVHGPGGVLYRQIVTVHGRSLVSVSGGAGRLVYLALAVLVGVFVWRRPQPPVRLVWLAAAVLAGRCVFEAVMTPYYLAPPLLLIVVVAATHRRVLRLWVAIAAGTAASVYAYQFVSPWLWWGPIVVLMGVALCCGYPPLGRDGGPEGPESAGIDGPVVSSEAVAAPAESRA